PGRHRGRRPPGWIGSHRSCVYPPPAMLTPRGAVSHPHSYGSPRAKRLLAQICFGRVATHHPMAVEIGCILRDRALHDSDPTRGMARAPVIERQHDALQLVVEVCRILYRPAGHPLDAALDPPPVWNGEA